MELPTTHTPARLISAGVFFVLDHYLLLPYLTINSTEEHDMTTYALDICGAIGKDVSYDVFAKSGRFVGIVAWKESKGFAKVYFNSTATKGSARKFASVQDAVEFIHNRRIKRGLPV